MKRIMLIIIVILISLNTSISRELKKVAIIDINTNELAKKLNYHSTQFFTRNKQNSDYIYTFEISDIIYNYLKNEEKNEIDKMIFIFRNIEGQELIVTFNEFDDNNSQLPAYLTYKKVTSQIGDTITIDESQGDLNLQELDETISHFTTRHRIGLQLDNLDKATKALINSNACLIFPKDITTKRWLKNVTQIIIFKID